jgi:hypothetical protein
MRYAIAYVLIAIRLGPIIIGIPVCLWWAFFPPDPIGAWKRIGYGVLGTGLLVAMAYVFWQL